MFIAIHLILHYIIECYHYFNDNIHLFFDKKTKHVLEKEKQIKQRKDDYLFWKLKQQIVKTIEESEYNSLLVDYKLYTESPTILWQFVENTSSNKKNVIMGQTCYACGEYDYSFPYCNCSRCKDTTHLILNHLGSIKYPYNVLCKCKKYNHTENKPKK